MQYDARNPRRIYAFLVPVVLSLIASAPQEEDPVREKLQTAEKVFLDRLEEMREPLLGDLERAREAATKTGKVEFVRRVEAERDAFRRYGRIPTVISTRKYRSRLTSEVNDLVKAFDDAASAYTKKNMLDQAEAVQQEMADGFWKGGRFALAMLPGQLTPEEVAEGLVRIVTILKGEGVEGRLAARDREGCSVMSWSERLPCWS